jgi:hypothetical protein
VKRDNSLDLCFELDGDGTPIGQEQTLRPIASAADTPYKNFAVVELGNVLLKKELPISRVTQKNQKLISHGKSVLKNWLMN